MEPGIELVIRVLLGGAAIRPSVGAPPTTCCCQSALEVVEKVVTGHRGTGAPPVPALVDKSDSPGLGLAAWPQLSIYSQSVKFRES